MRSISISLGILFFIIVSSTYSAASDWKEYFYSANDCRSHIDRNSIVHLTNGKVRAWRKFQSANGNGNLSLTEVDCKQRMYTIRAMEPINPNDTESYKLFEITMRTWTEPNQYWEYIGTTGSHEAMYSTWCTEKSEK